MDLDYLINFEVFLEAANEYVEILKTHLNEAYATWARMQLIGFDWFDLAS